jgi:hypothetical protein
MIAQAINATAGVGIGTFLGCLFVLFIMRRGGRDVQLIRDSIFFTAVAAGMGAWTLAAVVTAVLP